MGSLTKQTLTWVYYSYDDVSSEYDDASSEF